VTRSLNTLVTGREYIRALDARKSDRDCRTAFLERACSLLPPRSTVFDFGCGPGLDARAYASRGHRVYGFDVDAQMCAHFREFCAGEIASGSVRLVGEGQRDLLDLPADVLPPVDLVTADFAPLNLVENLPQLFARFEQLLAPRGQVLAGILNPLHSGDLRYGWWWRGLPRLVTRGQYSVSGAQAPITRWQTRRLARIAGEAFVLREVSVPSPRGLASWRRVNPSAPRDWPAIAASRYLFVLFARRTESA